MSNYSRTRAFLKRTLDKEAAQLIANNERLWQEIPEPIETYNRAVEEVNDCW